LKHQQIHDCPCYEIPALPQTDGQNHFRCDLRKLKSPMLAVTGGPVVVVSMNEGFASYQRWGCHLVLVLQELVESRHILSSLARRAGEKNPDPAMVTLCPAGVASQAR